MKTSGNRSSPDVEPSVDAKVGMHVVERQSRLGRSPPSFLHGEQVCRCGPRRAPGTAARPPQSRPAELVTALPPQQQRRRPERSAAIRAGTAPHRPRRRRWRQARRCFSTDRSAPRTGAQRRTPARPRARPPPSPTTRSAAGVSAMSSAGEERRRRDRSKQRPAPADTRRRPSAP